MRRGLSFRSGNPVLRKNTFSNIENVAGKTMTIQGTVNKTIISFICLFITAIYSWNSFEVGQSGTGLLYFGMIGGFILALVTIFKKKWAPYTVPMYAAFQGLFLGVISKLYETLSIGYPGIVLQAVFLTFGILASLLFAYKTRLIKPTENFKLGVAAATGGIMIAYIINFVVGWLFKTDLHFMTIGHPNMPAPMMSIVFSLFVVVIASLNLVLDFDFIEQGSEMGAPKYMEWYGAFGLLVTLIWLYLEILRLLSKLNSRRN